MPANFIGHQRLPEEDLAARIRAARAYAGLTRRGLISRIGRPEFNERLMAKFEDGSTKPSHEQLISIGRACELPTRFFTVDFDALEDPLNALVARVEGVADQVSRLEAMLGSFIAASTVG